MQPSELRAHPARRLARRPRRRHGRRVRPRRSTSRCATCRGRRGCRSSTRGSVPDMFQVGRDVYPKGALRRGTFRRSGHPRHAMPVEVQERRNRRARCLSSAAPLSSLPCCSPGTRRPRARRRPARGRRRLAGSAQSACSPPSRAPSSRRRCSSPRSSDTTSASSTSPITRAATCRSVHALRVLGRAGGVAAALAARAHRLLGARGRRSAAAPGASSSRGPSRCSAASRPSSRSSLVAVASPFATQAAPAEGAGMSRACRTRTCSPTRRCSTSATSG